MNCYMSFAQFFNLGNHIFYPNAIFFILSVVLFAFDTIQASIISVHSASVQHQWNIMNQVISSFHYIKV